MTDFLLVIANPFTVLDAKGNPCGICFSDPTRSRPFQVVGGRLTKQVVPHDDLAADPTKREPHDMREARVRVGALLDLRAQRVLDTEYHRARVQSGDAIAVDEATARACGIEKYLPPAQVMMDCLSKRVAEWKVEHGGAEPPCADFAFVQRGTAEHLVVDVIRPNKDGGYDAGDASKEGVLVVANLVARPGAKPLPLSPAAAPETPAAPATKSPGLAGRGRASSRPN